jgi:hypothetical protein
MNHKGVYRIYKEEGLNLRYKSKRRKISTARVLDKNLPEKVTEC